MTTTDKQIWCDEDLHQELKLLAVERKISMRALLRIAVQKIKMTLTKEEKELLDNTPIEKLKEIMALFP